MDQPVTKTIPTACGMRPERCDRVALVLQGGGALGAYQAGVYEALHENGIEPGWFAGVSIGGINAALIAGNPPERRVERLREFWNRISDSRVWPYTPDGDVFRKTRNMLSSWLSMSLGQPGFFSPWLVNPWISLPGAEQATSFYDNEPLRKTLGDLVDFSLINRPDLVRFCVGAVGVTTGNFTVFHNDPMSEGCVEIAAEHVMASGALPPALPMVRIGEESYWDGGLVSNTPLQFLLDQEEQLDSLVFQVDLFSARGKAPQDIPDVLERQKDIVYSSRTRANTDSYRRKLDLQREIHAALSKVPEADLTGKQRARRDALARIPVITIMQLIYKLKSYEGEAKDYEFSRSSMEEHWRCGYDDTQSKLTSTDWRSLPAKGEDIITLGFEEEAE